MSSHGAQGQPAQPPTHVVTSFLLRTDRGRDEILIVRRSQRVRTYRGAWAGISGYVEPSVTPIEQAYTEVREETGLARNEVRLLAEGKSLAFEDRELGQAWVVHPFLFAALAPERIRTDWEATEHRWISPGELAGLAMVPRLAEALALVYPSPGTTHGTS
jgi:ADP-ribose pyrophosphatase YjhB (NUDIX family)